MAVGRYLDGGLKVFGNDYPTVDGTCVRDYLHIVDLAQGHVLALDGIASGKVFTPPSSPLSNGHEAPPKVSSSSEPHFKAYNLGRGQAYSVLQIIAAMHKATGVDFPYEIVGRRDGDVPDLTADPTLAQQELGFVAKKGLEEACRDLWKWQTGNPSGETLLLCPPNLLDPNFLLTCFRYSSQVTSHDSERLLLCFTT